MQAIKGVLGKYLYTGIAVLCVLLISVAVFCYISTTSKTVAIDDGSSVTTLTLYGNATVSDVLAKSHIILEPYDTLEKSLDSYVENNETIVVNKDALDYASGYAGMFASLGESMIAESNAIYIQQLQASQVQSSFGATGASDSSSSVIGNTIVCYDGTYTIVQVVTVKATGYCPCSICCGEYASGYTADGSLATAGHTIAAPSTYPFGMHMYIPYFDRVFEVEDRGGAIDGNRIDVYFDTHDEALRFGVKTFEIYILE